MRLTAPGSDTGQIPSGRNSVDERHHSPACPAGVGHIVGVPRKYALFRADAQELQKNEQAVDGRVCDGHILNDEGPNGEEIAGVNRMTHDCVQAAGLDASIGGHQTPTLVQAEQRGQRK